MAVLPHSDLSDGQRQRLFIASALVNDPELVFLDEMTTGLDPAARHTAGDLIRAVRDAGTSVVLVTHFGAGGPLVGVLRDFRPYAPVPGRS